MEQKIEPIKRHDSLESYLKENEKLLTALGVFAALLVLFEDLRSPFFRITLSFLSITGMALIWLELCSKKSKSESLYLILFQYIISWGEIGLIGYAVYEFRTISNLFLFVPSVLLVFWFLAATSFPIFRRFNLTRGLFGIDRDKKTFLNKFLRAVSITIAVAVSFIVGVDLAFGVNIIFEGLKRVNF